MEWEKKEGKLTKEIECQDFKQAIELLNKIAHIAESMHHHPDLRIHSYKSLSIQVYTHDTNSITEKDHQLTKEIDLVLEEK